MSSTYSSLLRIELIGTGDQPGTWGDTTNTNLGTLIEQAIAATATVSVTLGNVTLTELNGSSDQSRCAALLITGTPGTTRNIVAPASSKIYVLSNASDSSVVLKTSSSTGLTIASGVTQLAYYNGTDFIAVGQPSDADLSAIAALSSTGLIARTGSGTAAVRTITASTGISVSNGDGVSGNPTVAVSTIPVANGGTNITSYTTGDLLYASGSTTLAKLADVATGNALISGGVGVAPSWGQIGLTTHVTGTLPVANGGTGATSLTGLAYGNGTSAFTAASAAQIVAAIGSTAVANATNATNAVSATSATTATTATTATSAGKLATSNFTIEESGGDLLVKYGATTIVTISSAGDITASGEITAS